MLEEKVKHIKALASEGLRRDQMFNIFGANHHKWQLYRPVRKRTIRRFETDMKITLPNM